MSRILRCSLSFCFAASLLSCTPKSPANSSEDHALNLAIWGNYLPPELQEQFQKESGIQLHISNYSSNEELLAKVQMGASGIDVAVPSDYMVAIMIKMNLLEPLQADQLSHQQNIDPRFLHPSYDPEGKYSVPYGWTTSGIAVNRDLFKEDLHSWKDFLQNPHLKGRMALLDDLRETLGAALKMQGHSVNTTDSKEIEQAQTALLAAKANVKMFTSDPIDILKNKEVVAAQAYSSDALQAAAKSQGPIDYVLPEEGSTSAVDTLVIMKGSPHLKAAHQLLQFLLRPEAEKIKVMTVFAGPVLTGTKTLLPQELQANKALFPEASQLQKLESLHDLGPQNHLYEDAWTAIKTH